jgi:hypothetical protein
VAKSPRHTPPSDQPGDPDPGGAPPGGGSSEPSEPDTYPSISTTSAGAPAETTNANPESADASASTDQPVGAPGTDTQVPEDLSRQVTTTLAATRTTIRLDQIDRETQKHIYCHRTTAELTDDYAKILVDSLVTEGQVTPVEFYRDCEGRAILVRGYRTVEAHHQIIGRQLDPGHFSNDMKVPAVELVGGSEVDYILRAVTSNEVRKHLSEEGKYQVAVLLVDRKVPATRAARAMGISTTVYQRYVKRHLNQWLQQYVKEEYVTQSDADDLLEAAGNKNALASLRTALTQAFTAVNNHITRLQEQAKVTREKLSPKVITPKTYVTKAKVKKQVLECLKKDKSIVITLGLGTNASATGTSSTGVAGDADVTGQAADGADAEGTAPTVQQEATGGDDDFTFECAVGEKDGKLKMKGLNGVTLSNLSHKSLAAILCKLTLLVDEISALHKTRKAAQLTLETRQTSTIPKMIAFYESIGETGLANALRAQIAPAGNGAGKGNGNGVGHKPPTSRVVQPIKDSISAPPKPEP